MEGKKKKVCLNSQFYGGLESSRELHMQMEKHQQIFGFLDQAL